METLLIYLFISNDKITFSGVDPAQSDFAPAELGTSQTTQNREPPPPYTPRSLPVTDQPPIIHQTIIVQEPLKDAPMLYNCPRCQERVLTKIEYHNTKNTHLLAGFVCGLTLWCMLCCLAAIPYYVSTFKEAQHFCPNCNTFLGTYSKI